MVALRRAETLRFCLNKLFSVLATVGSELLFSGVTYQLTSEGYRLTVLRYRLTGYPRLTDLPVKVTDLPSPYQLTGCLVTYQLTR